MCLAENTRCPSQVAIRGRGRGDEYGESVTGDRLGDAAMKQGVGGALASASGACQSRPAMEGAAEEEFAFRGIEGVVSGGE